MQPGYKPLSAANIGQAVEVTQVPQVKRLLHPQVLYSDRLEGPTEPMAGGLGSSISRLFVVRVCHVTCALPGTLPPALLAVLRPQRAVRGPDSFPDLQLNRELPGTLETLSLDVAVPGLAIRVM